MNIAIITPLPPGSPGGVEAFTSMLIQILREAGHNIKLFDKSILNKDYKGIMGFKLLGYYKLAYDLGKAFSRQRSDFDLVICNGMFGWGVHFPRSINVIHGSIAGHALAKRSAMNSLSYLKMRYLDSWFHTRSFRNKVLVVVSNQVGERCQKYNCVTDYRVIPNAVNTDTFKPRSDQLNFRKQFALPLDAFLGLFVGRAEYGKGFDVIEAVGASLEESHKIVVASANAKVNAKNLLLLKHVAHEDIPYLYNACDYFILPSRSEGCSVALLEALASGLPAIASDVGNAPEIAERDKMMGRFILEAPVDPGEFLRKAELLLRDPSLRAEVGRRARDYAIRHHSLHLFRQRYLKLIDTMLAEDIR